MSPGGNHSNILYWIAALCLVPVLLFAALNERVEAEKASPMPEIPLKAAMGDDAYKEVMESGKYRYVGNSKCRLCHRKFFIGRKKDPHDYAMDSLIASGYEENPRCLTCHSTGYGVDTGFVSMERTPRLANVQCEGCHGPGNVHIRLAKEKKPAGGFLAGVDHPERLAVMCKSCHTERWNRSYHDFEKAYDKYRNADPNTKEKEVCQ